MLLNSCFRVLLQELLNSLFDTFENTRHSLLNRLNSVNLILQLNVVALLLYQREEPSTVLRAGDETNPILHLQAFLKDEFKVLLNSLNQGRHALLDIY